MELKSTIKNREVTQTQYHSLNQSTQPGSEGYTF